MLLSKGLIQYTNTDQSAAPQSPGVVLIDCPATCLNVAVSAVDLIPQLLGSTFGIIIRGSLSHSESADLLLMLIA